MCVTLMVSLCLMIDYAPQIATVTSCCY